MSEDEFVGKRHFGLWQKKDRVVLVGYSRRNNDVLCVRLNHLPEDERHELVNIALNGNVQTKIDMIQVLGEVRHTKSGDTWFTNLAMRLHRGDGSVIRAFVKNLDDVDPAQMAYYKGYGHQKGPVISEAEKAAILGPDYKPPQARVGDPSQQWDGQTRVGDPRTQNVSTSAGDLGMDQEYVPEAMKVDENDYSKSPSSGPAQDSSTAAALAQLAVAMGKMAETMNKIENKIKPPKRGRPPKPKAAQPLMEKVS